MGLDSSHKLNCWQGCFHWWSWVCWAKGTHISNGVLLDLWLWLLWKNLLHHHCMQSVPPGKVRSFTLTRPNSQCRSVEHSHAYKTCLSYMESTVYAPVILSPLWQVKKILPVEMSLCFALLTEEEPAARPLLLVEESSVCQMKGKPWLGRLLPDLLPPPGGTNPPSARLHVRCSHVALLALADP